MRVKSAFSDDVDCTCQAPPSEMTLLQGYDVVIVGNGPSAIMLSFFLSGNWPYYNGRPVEHPLLQDRFKFVSQHKSLVEEDLEWLSEGLQDSRTFNPVSILFDQLYRPNADLLMQEPPLIEWRHRPEHEVKHVVLGKGPIGGLWHKMNHSQLSVSLSHWLEFPNYSFEEWLTKQKWDDRNNNTERPEGIHKDRQNCHYFGMYYASYVEENRLSRNFVNGACVNRIVHCDDNFVVKGELHNTPFEVAAKSVVLASGAFSCPRELGVPGEHLPFIRYTMPCLSEMTLSDQPVMVVGCGLVAMDTIMALMDRDIPCVHVFRREASDPEIIINHLSSAYGDYLAMKPLLWGKKTSKYYTPLSSHVVVEIREEKRVLVCDTKTQKHSLLDVSAMIVNIGGAPDMSLMDGMADLLEDPFSPFHMKNNPIEVDLTTYESFRKPGLYALGPLVGDNFVRFIAGGALGVTSGLWKSRWKLKGAFCHSNCLAGCCSLESLPVSDDDTTLETLS